MALSLSMLDLPLNEESHAFKATENRAIEIKTVGNAIFFLKEISRTDFQANKDLLVIHRYVEQGN